MKLPEPVAWCVQNATPPGGYVIFKQYPKSLADLGDSIEPLFTEAQFREALAQQADELKQLQEQNRWLDAKLVSHETAMEQALSLLGPQAPECCVCASEWNEAIKELEDALK